MHNDKLGHNKPPKTIDELIHNGRIELKNSVIKKLKRKVDDKGKYIETIYNDTERVGLKLKVNKGGSKTFFYQWYNKNKQRQDGGKGATDKQFIGQFPEWKIEAARQLVDKIKQGIKLGTDPRSTFEANKAIPTLAMVIDLWKKDVLEVSNTFRESTKKDLLARFRVWIDLNPRAKALQDYVLKNRKLLNIRAKQVHEITRDDLVKFHSVITKNNAPYQANRIIHDLKIIVKWAMKKSEWKIKENFAALDYDKELNPELSRIEMHRPYSLEEMRKIRKTIIKLAALKKVRKKVIYARNFSALMGILAAGFVGRRYGNEILNRPWSKVDTDRIILDKTKNERKPSSYPRNRYLNWILKQCKLFCKHKYSETRKMKYHHKSGYVFPSVRKSRYPYLIDVQKTWVEVLKQSGLAHRILPVYMLRHSWATNGLEKTNGNTYGIQLAGGWKTPRMVARYAAESEKIKRETAEKVARVMATGK
jgi:integrase